MASDHSSFAGLRVAAFESRRGSEMARLIERMDGVPQVSASLQEAPLTDNPQAVDFANRLITGQVDVVIFMTGVGVRYLLEQLERRFDRQRFLDALSDITTVARGPKPVVVLKGEGLTPTWKVPAPNTWRELLALLDERVPLDGRNVTLQEYGQTNPSLTAGLEARGARVENLQVYRWTLPEDRKPLENNVRALVAGEIDVVLFTSAQQAVHLMETAAAMDQEAALRSALAATVVASVGPTTSERLRSLEIHVDLEPEQPKMGALVAAAAERSVETLRRKQRLAVTLREAVVRQEGADEAAWHQSLFLRACRREPTERTPVWLMRQAGRYMAEYREVRSRMTFLELCKNPQLCSEVMCHAVQRLGVDAAIIFADLLPILEPMGMDLEFAPGDGPVIHNPLRETSDVDRLLELESLEALEFVMETVRQTRRDLSDRLPLIGFAGAPFTLASYAIEGGGSRTYLHTKTLMYRDRSAWNALMERLVRAVSQYLNAQIAAGAQAVQLFDSWVGCLSPTDYREFVLPHMRTLLDCLAPGVPTIHFGTGNPQLLPLQAEAGGEVVGVDWRIRLADAWELIGRDRAIQGNLEPAILLADPPQIRRHVADILKQANGQPGHIFNLGHGVLPQTPVEHAVEVVRLVKELSSRAG